VKVIRWLVSLVLFGAVLPGAFAETVFVTDELSLRLQAAPEESSQVLGSLRSGDRLELLEKSGFFALVKTEDGKQGWAKAAYLISERPARARLQEMEAELTTLRAGVEPIQKELASARQQSRELGQKLETSEQALGERTAALGQVEQENAELRQRLGIGGWSVPLRWVGVAMLLSLACGIGLGIWWFDFRSRKRHGGFRIY
jgi:SH3 domain protein